MQSAMRLFAGDTGKCDGFVGKAVSKCLTPYTWSLTTANGCPEKRTSVLPDSVSRTCATPEPCTLNLSILAKDRCRKAGGLPDPTSSHWLSPISGELI